MKISEAVEMLKKKDWVLIHSDKLDDKFILKRHQKIVSKKTWRSFKTCC